jgi:hypothetical protein
VTKKLAPFAAPKAPPKPSPSPAQEAKRRAFVQDEAHESRLRRPQAGERLGIYLPTALAQELRHAAVEDRRSVSDAITAAVEAWLEARRAGR